MVKEFELIGETKMNKGTLEKARELESKINDKETELYTLDTVIQNGVKPSVYYHEFICVMTYDECVQIKARLKKELEELKKEFEEL